MKICRSSKRDSKEVCKKHGNHPSICFIVYLIVNSGLHLINSGPILFLWRLKIFNNNVKSILHFIVLFSLNLVFPNSCDASYITGRYFYGQSCWEQRQGLDCWGAMGTFGY